MSIVEVKINFSYSEKAPRGYKKSSEIYYFEPFKKMRLVPVLAIYGYNASGKTNIIKAFDTFKKLVLGDFNNLYRQNRLFCSNNPTTFKCNFCIKQSVYSYSITYSNMFISQDVLLCNDQLIFKIVDHEFVFTNLSSSIAYTPERLNEIFQVECTDQNKRQTRTFISRLGLNYRNLNFEASSAYLYFKNINIYPENNFSLLLNEDLLSQVTEMLQKFDIDIEKLQINTIFKNSDIIQSYHKDINGNLIEFQFFEEESNGTKILGGLLGVFLSVLKKDGVLIIDELDKSLHPCLFENLVKIFKDKDYNTCNAQLIFTTNDTILFDYALHRSEIAIVDKTLKRGTIFHKIADYDGVKNIVNFKQQYLLGIFKEE